MEPSVSSRGPTRETEVQREVSLRSWRGYLACLEGPRKEGEPGAGRGSWDLGLILQLGSLGRALWAAWRKAGFVNSHHEEWRFDKLHGGLISRHTRGRSGKA